MKLAESKLETIAHIELVRKYIKIITDKLTQRGINHDKTKLESPEAEGFARVNERLSGLMYGTPEYEENLKDLQDTLSHHYAKNKHHPEHYKNGINDMNLIDLLEMMADWKASTYRQHDGNLLQSIEKNAKKYGISPQLLKLMKNTAVLFDEEDTNK